MHVHCLYIADEDKLPAICNYLHNLSKAEVTEIAIQMGLSYRWLKDHESSDNYRYDVVDAWLKKQDSVGKMCPPTWQNLVAKLRQVDQHGIANQVAVDMRIAIQCEPSVVFLVVIIRNVVCSQWLFSYPPPPPNEGEACAEHW